MAGEETGGIGDMAGKMGKELGKAFTDNFNPSVILETLRQVDDGAAKVLGTFGASREAVAAIRQNLANAIPDVTELGGNWESILSIQQEVSTTLGKNLVLSTEAFKDMYATMKASGQEASTITKSFKDVGISVYDATKQMNDVVNVARASGVNASAVSGQVLQNMESLNKYNFEGGVQGLAKMAAQAVSLRIDMKDSLAFAEKVFDPEGAINMAASMQRLGVAQSDLLDPLRMMDLAQNDPGELQNQMSKMSQQFVQLKKDGTGFEIMPGAKRQMREIESAMGLPLGQLSKMALASADLDDKMKKIKFPTATDEQKTMIANMAEMKGGQYVVNFTDKDGKAQEKAVSELNPDDMKALVEASKPKSMEELAKGQLNTSERIAGILEGMSKRLPAAIAGSRGGKAVTEAPREIIEGLGTVASGKGLSAKSIGQGLDKTTDIAFDVLNKFAKGTGTMADVSTAFSKISENTKTAFGSTWTEAMGNAGTAAVNLGKSQNGIIQLLNTGIGTLEKKLGVSSLSSKATSATGAQKLKVDDFIIETHKQDELKLVGGTNLMGDKSGGSQGSSESTMNVNFTLKLEGNHPVTEEQVKKVFKDTGMQEEIIKSIKLHQSITKTESSPHKIMNHH